ncbi:lipoprotein [Propionivibrio sp.]|uniref:LPS translocon maturation chaperone LptM n=1 Tax=Propionivibrio sp. TaxID=2212460 RepID=UPI003426913E
MRGHCTLLILLLTFAFGACGTRGPLTLPPPQIKTPATPASAAPADLNTPEEPAR